MVVACCQLDIAWEDKARNHARVKALIDRTPLPAGSLLLLPEMFATGFSMNLARACESAEHETERFLATLARERGLFVLGGVANVAPDGRGRNEAVAFDPGGRELARYCKLHPFTYGGESEHFAAGEHLAGFDWVGCRVAPFVCYDLRFPEAFRVAVRRGVRLFVVIANWPAERESHWVTLLRARAIENQAYVAGANRCGSDPAQRYGGRSLIVDPRGEILADAGSAEGIIQAPIDLAALEAYRQAFPVLSDMRADLS
jgi:omega-amidase